MLENFWKLEIWGIQGGRLGEPLGREDAAAPLLTERAPFETTVSEGINHISVRNEYYVYLHCETIH